MTTLEPIIASHPFFKDLEPAHLQLVVGCASNTVFRAGSFLCRVGDDAGTFYLIRQGTVAIELVQPGAPLIGIQTLGAGEVLGWSWLFPPHEWRFDGRAVELTRAIALDGTCLRKKCETDHHLGYELMKRFSQVLVQRLEATRLQLMDLYGVKV